MAKTAKKSATKSPQLIDETFRVYRYDEQTREAMKDARAASGLTVKSFVAHAIETQLAEVVGAVVAAGIVPHHGKTRPCRLPLTDGIVAMLQEASRMTSLDQSALLLACFRRAAVGTTKAIKTKGRKPRAKAAAAKA